MLADGRYRTAEGKLTRFDPCRERVCFRRFRGWKQKTARLVASNSLAQNKALLFVCILLGGCRSRQGDPKPSIEFTQLPPAGQGSPDLLHTIEGRVTGAHRSRVRPSGHSRWQHSQFGILAGDLWQCRRGRETASVAAVGRLLRPGHAGHDLDGGSSQKSVATQSAPCAAWEIRNHATVLLSMYTCGP